MFSTVYRVTQKDFYARPYMRDNNDLAMLRYLENILNSM